MYPANIIGIFTRSAATTLMHQKLDSINILKNLGTGGRVGLWFQHVCLGGFRFAFSIKPSQFRYLFPIDVRLGKTPSLLESLF